LLSSSPTSATPNSRMVTRNRSKVNNNLQSPSPFLSAPAPPVTVPAAGSHGSPIEHHSAATMTTAAGYMSPGPEKSTRKRNSLPSHPSSCSPYRTRAQARCSSHEVIPPVSFHSEHERKEIRYTSLPPSVSSHPPSPLPGSYCTDHEEFSLTNHSMNGTPTKSISSSISFSSSATSPLHHSTTATVTARGVISPCDEEQYEILQSLLSPPPQQKQFSYRRAMHHSGNNLIFGSPTPAERAAAAGPQKV
jgi:hypothetical protein